MCQNYGVDLTFEVTEIFNRLLIFDIKFYIFARLMKRYKVRQGLAKETIDSMFILKGQGKLQ